MNYEEKYKQALERAMNLFVTNNVSALVIGEIFPELTESEDEQSKKWILEYLYDGLRKSDEQFKDQFKTAIVWLEKQGKKLDADKVIEWLKDQACLGWIEDVPVDEFVDKFKKDFEL